MPTPREPRVYIVDDELLLRNFLEYVTQSSFRVNDDDVVKACNLEELETALHTDLVDLQRMRDRPLILITDYDLGTSTAEEVIALFLDLIPQELHENITIVLTSAHEEDDPAIQAILTQYTFVRYMDKLHQLITELPQLADELGLLHPTLTSP